MNFENVLNFKINDKTFIINFPTNRQYIDIHNTKAILASQYAEFKFMGAESSYAEVLVDTIAHLQILCPDLIKSLNRDLLDLDLQKRRELTVAYNSQFRPWYNENLNYIFGVGKNEETEDEKNNSSEQK